MTLKWRPEVKYDFKFIGLCSEEILNLSIFCLQNYQEIILNRKNNFFLFDNSKVSRGCKRWVKINSDNFQQLLRCHNHQAIKSDLQIDSLPSCFFQFPHQADWQKQAKGHQAIWSVPPHQWQESGYSHENRLNRQGRLRKGIPHHIQRYNRKHSMVSDSSDVSDDEYSQKSSTIDSRISKNKQKSDKLEEFRN